ncbi:MAG TPA: tripartite tricarboxylate transporter substrate binding protein [Burkholderiales bacterium]|nr:tripartite tricarboxylate transporter substrate binding protein [Burkholderiales bacterium]
MQVIVAFTAGGSVDVMARNLVALIAAQLGQPFVVVNRDGATGTIGFGQLANAPADGYTLGAGPTTPISIAPHLIKNVKFGPDSFEYICQSFENIFTVAVSTDSPYRSIADVITAARARPGKLSYGHSGVGTVPHLSVANLAYRSKVDVQGVPYRGEASMLPDLIAGRFDFGAPSVAAATGQKVRVLAVFADARHPVFPDAPTFVELGMPSMPPGLNGLFAPKGTPREVLAVLERACEQATQTEAFRSASQRLSQRVAYLNGATFAERALADYRYKGELIEALGIRLE